MIGQLTKEQIDTLLVSCVVGHLGCCADNTPYVVSIAYAYDGTYIYSHAITEKPALSAQSQLLQSVTLGFNGQREGPNQGNQGSDVPHPDYPKNRKV